MVSIQGTDLSGYQELVNFDELKKSVEFTMIRSSWGCGFKASNPNAYVDVQFRRNQAEARRINIPRAFYHLCYPAYNSPEEEAEYFKYVVGDLQPGEGLVLDLEQYFDGDYDDWCVRFLDKMQSYYGFKPLFYTRGEFINLAKGFKRVIQGDYGFWYCYPDNDPNLVPQTPWPVLAMKQYTIDVVNRGQLRGIADHLSIDKNTFFGSVDTFLAYGYRRPPVIEVPQPKPDVLEYEVRVNIGQEPFLKVAFNNPEDAKTDFDERKIQPGYTKLLVQVNVTKGTEEEVDRYTEPIILQDEFEYSVVAMDNIVYCKSFKTDTAAYEYIKQTINTAKTKMALFRVNVTQNTSVLLEEFEPDQIDQNNIFVWLFNIIYNLFKNVWRR